MKTLFEKMRDNRAKIKPRSKTGLWAGDYVMLKNESPRPSNVKHVVSIRDDGKVLLSDLGIYSRHEFYKCNIFGDRQE